MCICRADDLVSMEDNIEKLHVKFDKCKDAIERKGMKVNIDKTIVMGNGEGVEKSGE